LFSVRVRLVVPGRSQRAAARALRGCVAPFETIRVSLCQLGRALTLTLSFRFRMRVLSFRTFRHGFLLASDPALEGGVELFRSVSPAC
jgi:hypothetical protein